MIELEINPTVESERKQFLTYIQGKRSNLEIIFDKNKLDIENLDNEKLSVDELILIGKKAILVELESWIKKRMGLLKFDSGIVRNSSMNV
jgi:hypothetical protein